MYVAKVFTRNNKKILYHTVRHYNNLATAIGDISEKSIFENLDNDMYDTLGKCTIVTGGINTKTDIPDDFEFRFENGVTVYVGTIVVEEELK